MKNYLRNVKRIRKPLYETQIFKPSSPKQVNFEIEIEE